MIAKKEIYYSVTIASIISIIQFSIYTWCIYETVGMASILCFLAVAPSSYIILIPLFWANAERFDELNIITQSLGENQLFGGLVATLLNIIIYTAIILTLVYICKKIRLYFK